MPAITGGQRPVSHEEQTDVWATFSEDVAGIRPEASEYRHIKIVRTTTTQRQAESVCTCLPFVARMSKWLQTLQRRTAHGIHLKPPDARINQGSPSPPQQWRPCSAPTLKLWRRRPHVQREVRTKSAGDQRHCEGVNWIAKLPWYWQVDQEEFLSRSSVPPRSLQEISALRFRMNAPGQNESSEMECVLSQRRPRTALRPSSRGPGPSKLTGRSGPHQRTHGDATCTRLTFAFAHRERRPLEAKSASHHL